MTQSQLAQSEFAQSEFTQDEFAQSEEQNLHYLNVRSMNVHHQRHLHHECILLRICAVCVISQRFAAELKSPSDHLEERGKQSDRGKGAEG